MLERQRLRSKTRSARQAQQNWMRTNERPLVNAQSLGEERLVRRALGLTVSSGQEQRRTIASVAATKTRNETEADEMYMTTILRLMLKVIAKLNGTTEKPRRSQFPQTIATQNLPVFKTLNESELADPDLLWSV